MSPAGASNASSTREDVAIRRAGRIAFVPVLAVVAAALAWLRLDATTRDTLWAEDASLFLQQQLDGALPQGIFTPYAGYLQVVPRIVTTIVAAASPVTHYALAITLASVIIAGGIAALIFVLSRDLGLSAPARAAIALVTVLAPPAVYEALGNQANVHSLLLWLTPFLLLARPRSWIGSALLAVVAFLVATSEIQSLVFLPLALWHIRDRKRWPIVGALTAGLVLEAIATLLNPRTVHPKGHPDLVSIIHGYALQAGGGEWFNRARVLGRIVANDGWFIAYLLLIPVVATAVFLLLKSRRDRVIVISFAVASVILWVVGFYLNLGANYNYATYNHHQLVTAFQLRYGLVPAMLMLAVLVIGADRLFRRRGVAPKVIGAVLALALIATVAVNFSTLGHTQRSGGPSWSHGVADAVVQCATLDPSARVPIAAAPEDKGWQLVLSCERLLANRG